MTDATNPSDQPWRQFACLFCGHVHDEEAGDPDNGIAPGTRWEDIPEDWCCPLCSAEKASFTQV